MLWVGLFIFWLMAFCLLPRRCERESGGGCSCIAWTDVIPEVEVAQAARAVWKMRSTLLCSARGVAEARPFLLCLITPDRGKTEGHRATYTAQIETYVASQHGSNEWHCCYTAFSKILFTDVFSWSIRAYHRVCCCVRRHRNFIPDCQARKSSHVFFHSIGRLFWLMTLFVCYFVFMLYT